jgi:hypothetical protein
MHSWIDHPQTYLPSFKQWVADRDESFNRMCVEGCLSNSLFKRQGRKDATHE